MPHASARKKKIVESQLASQSWFWNHPQKAEVIKSPRMKKIVSLSYQSTSVAASLCLMVAATLAVTFWLAAGPSTQAQAPCTVCHKRTSELTFTCNSLDYRRHLDHGDTMGKCNITPVENP
jgi:hypothetical protein